MGWLTQNEEILRSKFNRFSNFLVFKRFLKRFLIVDINKCWEWQKSKDKDGYGSFDWPEKGISQAHVASYVLFVGRIPTRHGKKMCICHLCDNPSCVNPTHLWLGTSKQNNKDRDSKGRRAPTYGEHNGQARLTSSKVNKIKMLYRKGWKQFELANRYGVTQGHISELINGKKWNCA